MNADDELCCVNVVVVAARQGVQWCAGEKAVSVLQPWHCRRQSHYTKTGI